jgi:hypothetical protein
MEKITFGYQIDQKESIFKKNKETYFHIPAYTNSIKLAQTDLIANGAAAGAFPAASDRIFKSKKNYGNTTEHGTPSDVADGMWFCSWLYKNPNTGVIQWMDRFYNPGKFDYSIAKAQLLEYPPYVQLDPIFKDLPSKMTFEPGVLYRYFHHGEKSFDELLTTFEGVSSEYLGLHLLNWGTDTVDRSPNQNSVIINSNAPSSVLYEQTAETDRIFNPTIGFNNQYNVDCYLNYNSNYMPFDEFTWSFWAHSDNWPENVSTQLIGNFSTQGGVGVFIDTLETYPFIVIPETYYGHTLFLNQEGNKYLDKTLQKNFSKVNPTCFAVDSNDNVLICNKDTAGVIYKMDHLGKIVRSTKNLSDPNTLFAFSLSGEFPKQALCGRNDDFYVVSNRAVYVFDNELVLKQTIPQNITDHTVATFSYNTEEDTENFELVNNVYDVKFVETVKWSLSASDGNLYKDNELFQTFQDDATKMSIDPNGNIWIAHGVNSISIVDPTLASNESIIKTFTVGSFKERSEANKNISFLKQYDRRTSKKQWLCAIYYSDEKQLYFFDLNGVLQTVTDLSTLLDQSIVRRYNQDIELLEFFSKGDFTGYERKRIFNQLSPYNNKPQIVIKASAKDTSKDTLFFRTFKAMAPIDSWSLDSSQHILLTYKNKKLELWINSESVATLDIRGQYLISYELQPSFYIGSPTGNALGLNNELNSITSIFNGKIGDVRIYSYALPKFNIETFMKASMVSSDLYWPMTIPLTQYVELVEQVFKHKLPGAKSQFFKVKIKGSDITDSLTKEIVEAELKQVINSIKPSYTDLLKIEWL